MAALDTPMTPPTEPTELPIRNQNPNTTPPQNARAQWEHLFRRAFSPRQQSLHQRPPAPEDTPNEVCGDPLGPNFDGLHVWSNNVNTLSLGNDLADLHELCIHFKSDNIGIAALQEINLDLTQTKIYSSIKAVFDEHFGKQCTVICSSTPIRAETSWKPGSTMLVVMPQWTPYVTKISKDDLGRWCSATLQINATKSLVFYSFYNCCKTTIDHAGLHTVYAQQWHILRRRGDRDPDPRVQAVHDLSAEIHLHQIAKTSICIVGDFNETLGENPALMAHICSKYNLLDILDHRHPDDAHIPSYARSNNRLDYAIVSRDLVPYVTASGLHHYHHFYPSDHRPLYIGLHNTLFGSRPAITPARTRAVNSNAANVQSFIVHSYQHLVDTGTLTRLGRFLTDLPTLTDDQITNTANSIDEQITRALLSAEQKCQQPSREPWSDELHFASLKVKYWRLTRAAEANHYDCSLTLAATNAALPAAHRQTPNPEISTARSLNKAKRALVQARHDAKDLRKKFLETRRERIATRKTSSLLSPEAALKCIDKQLRQTNKFGNIQHALKPNTNTPLNKVHVTTTRSFIDPLTGARRNINHVEVVDTREELEQRILQRNKRHFSQAEGTPYTRHPLNNMTPANALTDFFDTDGSPIQMPDGTFLETRTVMQILQEELSNPPPTIQTVVPFEDFVTAFLHWDEKTSTSPSGRHLGLYQSIVTAHCDSGSEFDDAKNSLDTSTKSKATAILQAIHLVATSVAERGLYLARWTNVINVMIYKKAGVLELEELRVLHLFEADFNLLVGLIFGRWTIHNAVNTERLHPNQFGKKGGECMDAAVSKVLHNTIATYTKTPMSQFESDATACFDRIVMTFAMLCFFLYGCPAPFIKFWHGVLTNHCHQVKTAYGISQGSYSYEAASPIHGPGQGSKGGPGACVVSTSVLLQGQDRLARGIAFCDPSKSRTYTNTAAMFLDDNSSASNRFDHWLQTPPEPSDIVADLQKDAQTWERLLFTSGGLLKLRKCLYYVMAWDFDTEGRASLRPKADIPPLKLTNGHEIDPKPIIQHDCSEAHRYLGLWNSPSLSMKAQLTALSGQATSYTQRLYKSGLDPSEVWLAYFSCFLPAMTFTFAVTSFTSVQLRRLQQSATRATLAKLGLNRNISREVVFGSPLYGGLGLSDLVTEQGIAQLQLLMRHLRAGTPQGTLFLIGLSWWHLATGFSTPLWENPATHIPYIERSWYTSLKDFLDQIHGCIHIPTTEFIHWHQLRENDANIMATFSAMPGVSRADLAAANRCRLALGIFFLSELTTADGRRFDRAAWIGTRPRCTPFLWPYQPPPGPQSWRTWRRLLAQAFLAHAPKRVTPTLKNLSLMFPLGNWLPGSTWLQNNFKHFYSPATSQIYRANGDSYSIHTRIRSSRHRSQVYSAWAGTSTTALPSDSVPVDELSSSGEILAFRRTAIVKYGEAPLPAPPPTFSAHLTSIPLWDQRLLASVTLHNEQGLLTQLQSDEPLYIVSDGGAAGHLGSYGALVANGTETFVSVAGTTEGILPGSFRAESYGCLAILRLIFHLVTYHRLAIPSVLHNFYCDNQGLLTRLEHAAGPLTPFPRHYLRSDIDVEMQILDTLKLLDLKLQYIHVKGHQDSTPAGPTHLLSRQATLNVNCDTMATASLKTATPAPHVTFLPASKITVSVAGVTITRKLPRMIREIVGKATQLASFTRRYGWSPAQFDQVDWPMYKAAVYKFSLAKRLFTIKWLNDLLPFQSRMHKYGQASMAGCPHECGCASEDHNHLLHCTSPMCQDTYESLAPDLGTLCLTHHIDPDLHRALLTLVGSTWGLDTDPTLPPSHSALVQFQQALHPDSMFMGCFSIDWVRLQATHLERNNRPRDKRQAETGIRSILIFFLEHTHRVWLARNSSLHGDDTTTQLLSYRHTQLLLDIQDLYDQQDSMLAADRRIFSKPYDYWIDQPTAQLKTFLLRMRPTVQTSVLQAADMGTNFRTIDTYFPTPIPQDLIEAIHIIPYFPPEPD